MCYTWVVEPMWVSSGNLRELGLSTSGSMGVFHYFVFTHTKYASERLCPLCTDNTWCTEDERRKQITCHGVRKQLWQWMLQIPVCMACTQGPEWGLCVGNSLAPVSASVPLNRLLKPSFPEQVLMSAACTHGNLSGFPQKEAVPSSPVDSVLLFLSSLPLVQPEHTVQWQLTSAEVHRAVPSKGKHEEKITL